MTYLLPSSVDAALSALAETESTVLAGATDFYPARVAASGSGGAPDIVDISALDELRGFTRDGDQLRIGSLTTWASVATADLPASFRGLVSAALQVGGVQIQNVATVGGNLCNASPAADGVPPLLTLDASVELRSVTGLRVLRLDEFILGNRSTAKRSDEILTAVIVPDPAVDSVGSFEKLGSRAYLVISIVMVAALARFDSAGTIRSAKVAVGACSPVAMRLTELENHLVGLSVDQPLDQLIDPEHLGGLSPIDDVRGPASYRLEMTPTLIARALRAALEGQR